MGANFLLLGLLTGPSPGFSSRRGQKPEGGAKFFKYSIGCMQQPVGQTWNGGHQFQKGARHHWPPRWRRLCLWML